MRGLCVFMGEKMSFLSVLDGKARSKLIQAVVEQLVRDVSPEKINGLHGGVRLSVNKITRHLERAYSTIRADSKDRAHGFLSRALLSNAFKWALLEKGYSKDFADMATEGLIVSLSKRD